MFRSAHKLAVITRYDTHTEILRKGVFSPSLHLTSSHMKSEIALSLLKEELCLCR